VSAPCGDVKQIDVTKAPRLRGASIKAKEEQEIFAETKVKFPLFSIVSLPRKCHTKSKVMKLDQEIQP
jgi:hypothetical protein